MAEPNRIYGIVVVQTTRTEYEVPAWSANHAKQIMEECTKNEASPPDGVMKTHSKVERTVIKRAVPKEEPKKKPGKVKRELEG